MDVAELVATYGESWNEPDEAARRKLLDAAWSDDGTYCDPTASVSGREELLAHIAGMRDAFPGSRIEPSSGVEEHHGWFRFAWTMVDATGATAIEGFDVGSLADDGRIGRIVGFFGPFPEAPAAS
jgi:hypothetical protein